MILKYVTVLLLHFSLSEAKVIIIGAGPSGIAAATRLLENNITDILILEAENRIGGRVHTIDFAAGKQDLGAQWCHGQVDSVVYEMANPLGLVEQSKYPYENMDFVNAKGEVLPKSLLNNLTVHFQNFEELGMAPLNKTYGEYITEVFYKYVEHDEYKGMDEDLKANLLRLWHLMMKSLDATNSWFDLTIKSQLEYDDLEGSNLIVWKGRGYRTILDVMMKNLPDPKKKLPIDDKILLNKEVVNINWDNDQVKIKCKDGSEYTADRVIVTTSLGVLKDQYQTLFTPELPKPKIDTIKAIGFGLLGKLIFEFPAKWWDDDFELVWFVYSKLSENPELQKLLEENDWLRDTMGYQAYDYQPNCLLSWMTGESGRKIERLDENLVKEKLMTQLRMLMPNHTIPDPVNFLRTQWDSNSHFRGAYSYDSLAMEKQNISRIELLQPLRNSKGVEVVQFAGEATHPKRYGTVHGAIETGWREADRILKLLKS